MAYGRTSGFGSSFIRFLIVFGIGALLVTVMGVVDLCKDLFGSHRDFEDMERTDFKAGDIVHGTITETIGCAATITTTETFMYVVETDEYVSAAYYIIPYFDDVDDPYPNKIFFYKTGNKTQMSQLESLTDETLYWYSGQRDGTSTRVSVDRAEITTMDSRETEALYGYLDEFVEHYYNGCSSQDIEYMKISYHDAVVPYLLQYNAAEGNVMLTVGIIMLAIFVILLIIFLVRSKKATTYTPQHTYVGGEAPVIGNDPNLNSPTGLTNASDRFYGGASGTPGAAQQGQTGLPGQTTAGANPVRTAQTGVPPYMANARQTQAGIPPHLQQNGARPVQPATFRTDYSSSERPMPPVTPPQSGAVPKREMNFDPYTGKPLEKKTLVDATFGTPGANRNYGMGMRQQQRAPLPLSSDDSMPSVDPKTEDNVDLSNGGISWEDRSQRNASMPKNGDVPVINPESHNAAAMFGTIIPVEAETHEAPETPEPEPELVDGKVSEIHPPTKADNISSDFQVEETDQETRNIYKQMAGGQMNEVDPYTEKNVDISNGGVELPEGENETDTRRSFAQPAPAAAPAPSFPTPEPIQPAPVQPAPAPEPSQPDDYNIFKTGGSSYNIFKDSAPSADSNANMGFPVENKEFPKVDTSFPEAGESDVGGKDDFIF